MASKAESIRTILAAGRVAMAKGRTCEAAALVEREPTKMRSLIECMWDEVPGVANRAADAVEQLTRGTAKWNQVDRGSAKAIQPWKAELIGLLSEAKPIRLRWNLAIIVTRLKLTLGEARAVAQLLEEDYLADKSSIVKTLALQGLYNLSRQHASLEAEVVEMLQIHGRSGTPAMRARSKNLLISMEKQASAKQHALLNG